MYFDLYYSDDKDFMWAGDAIYAIRKYCKSNNISPITLLQIEEGVTKQLLLKENAKNKMSINFKYDMRKKCYTIDIYAHQLSYFIKLGDEVESDGWVSSLHYEIPFYGECPVYGLMRIKESDLTKAIMYALADSRIDKSDYI